MRQQLLDLHIPADDAYGAWVRHPGVEVAHNRLALWLVHGGRLWLSSDASAGKSHLLHAIHQEHPYLGIIRVEPEPEANALRSVRSWLAMLEPQAFWIVDVQAGPLPHACGIALFHLIERAREMHRPLLIAWRCPEEDLAPPEFVSRLKGMERLDIHAPRTDEDLQQVLLSVAKVHQWPVNQAILDLLFTKLPRRLPVLLETLQAMETASLEERKRLNVAWARKFLHSRPENLAQRQLPDSHH